MGRRRVLFIILATAACSAAAAGRVGADDHIVTESSRTYMGRTTPPRATETWLRDGAVAVRSPGTTTIIRFDLKKRWTIVDQNKKYFEEPLEAAAPASSAAKIRIQEMGFDYEPVFAWTVTETGDTRTINGLACRKVIAQGEADYAEERREMWVAGSVAINLDRHRTLMVERDTDPTMAELSRKSPVLTSGIAMETTIVRTPPIAPEMTWVFRVAKLEGGVTAPAGMYEIPPGYTRAATLDELFAR